MYRSSRTSAVSGGTWRRVCSSIAKGGICEIHETRIQVWSSTESAESANQTQRINGWFAHTMYHGMYHTECITRHITPA